MHSKFIHKKGLMENEDGCCMGRNLSSAASIKSFPMGE